MVLKQPKSIDMPLTFLRITTRGSKRPDNVPMPIDGGAENVEDECLNIA